MDGLIDATFGPLGYSPIWWMIFIGGLGGWVGNNIHFDSHPEPSRARFTTQGQDDPRDNERLGRSYQPSYSTAISFLSGVFGAVVACGLVVWSSETTFDALLPSADSIAEKDKFLSWMKLFVISVLGGASGTRLIPLLSNSLLKKMESQVENLNKDLSETKEANSTLKTQLSKLECDIQVVQEEKKNQELELEEIRSSVKSAHEEKRNIEEEGEKLKKELTGEVERLRSDAERWRAESNEAKLLGFISRASQLADEKKYNAAKEMLDKAFEIRESAVGYDGLALVASYTDRVPEAIEYSKKALEYIDKEDGLAPFQIADIVFNHACYIALSEQPDMLEIKRSLTRALELDPSLRRELKAECGLIDEEDEEQDHDFKELYMRDDEFKRFVDELTR